ncbi:MAG: hypothetical protein ACOYL5_09460 [Phototrophicaceae bacterium]|jgi:hypothetical protein
MNEPTQQPNETEQTLPSADGQLAPIEQSNPTPTKATKKPKPKAPTGKKQSVPTVKETPLRGRLTYKPAQPSDRYYNVAQSIAEQLNETEYGPRGQIHGCLIVCGVEFTQIMLEFALLLEAEGGMLTADGSRKRTLGGIFFYMARGALPADQRGDIFPAFSWKQFDENHRDPIWLWDERTTEFAHLLTAENKVGKATDVRIILRGRPELIETRDDTMIMVLEQAPNDRFTVPRGVPIPTDPTRYMVYADTKQWKKGVGDKLKGNQEAMAQIEGLVTLDQKLGVIAVMMTSVKVVIEKPLPTPEEKAAAKAAKAPQTEILQTPADEQTDGDMPDLSAYPKEFADKLRALYGSRRMFKRRLIDLEKLPPDKQAGLKSTQMMLERVEKQISDMISQGP